VGMTRLSQRLGSGDEGAGRGAVPRAGRAGRAERAESAAWNGVRYRGFCDGLAPRSIYEHFPCAFLAFSDHFPRQFSSACRAGGWRGALIGGRSAGRARAAKGASDAAGRRSHRGTPYFRLYPPPPSLCCSQSHCCGIRYIGQLPLPVLAARKARRARMGKNGRHARRNRS
jgi:hypothetical protein